MRRSKLLSQSSYKVVFLMRNWVALLCFLAGLLRFIGGSFLHRSNQIKVVAVFFFFHTLLLSVWRFWPRTNPLLLSVT